MSDTSKTRNTPPWVTGVLILLGVVLIVVAVIYFTDTAAKLPSFFPGHQAASSHHHTKHGLAALIVGVLALVGAWMSGGARKTTS
ncbi:MAG: hypothetical protein QOG80_1453 [Pseudonocardiales bacterium]|nr:hypothetical protein [Pseudonocardiales bacterium]